MIYIGIDNGLDGALVALSDHPGSPIAMIAMPVSSKPKGREVDALKVAEWILNFRNPISVMLEIPGKFTHKLALCSMWDSFGSIRAILEISKIRHHRIHPQAWQRKMLIGCEAGNTKPAALARAKQLWPKETWLKSSRCSVAHDGMIDAALIAEYARINKK